MITFIYMLSLLVQKSLNTLPLDQDSLICSGPFCPSIENPGSALGTLIARLFSIILVIGGGLVMIYLVWGAIDWISSSGEKEKIQKAQHKLTYALIGIVILFSVWTVWSLVTGDILGIIKKQNGSWIINLPTLQ